MVAKSPTPRVYLVVFGLLLILLAATVAVSQIQLGKFNAVVALSIAFAKAVLVILYFMQARYTGSLIRLVAVGALVWLVILIGLMLCDYVTREPPRAAIELARPREQSAEVTGRTESPAHGRRLSVESAPFRSRMR